MDKKGDESDSGHQTKRKKHCDFKICKKIAKKTTSSQLLRLRSQYLSSLLGNVDDRKGLLAIASCLFGKLYADKGYIGKDFARKMKDKGIEVLTRVRKNMLEVVHSEFDKALLRKRSVVETVFDELKNLCQIEHTRHRSLSNFAVNLLAGIVAYCLQPVKPRIAVRDSRDLLAVN